MNLKMPAARSLLVLIILFVPACDPTPQPDDVPTPTPPPAVTQPPTPNPQPSTPPPPPTPTPPVIETVPRKQIDVSKLYNGVLVETKFVQIPSQQTASQDRTDDDDAYALRLTFEAKIPTASQTLGQITRNSPQLPIALPGLAALLNTAKVSPAFAELYDRKVVYTKARLNRLDTILTRHNFYDCDTILELENPETSRRALFLQGDMDVNTDGSDGDRNFTVDGSSQFFQPQTSYRWRRQTDRPNPFLETTKQLLADAEEEYKIVGLPVERNRQLEATIAHEKATLYELDVYSFLISGAEPFIVLPGFMIRNATGPFAPKIGDYAAVIYDGTVYPALLGDVGPSFKVGEASLRLTQQLNPKSSAYSRPVSTIDVTYLVFPGTAEEESGPPDLDLWHAKVSTLIADLGLTPSSIHRWENVIQPWPTPTPSPSPSPTASPTATPATPTPSPTTQSDLIELM